MSALPTNQKAKINLERATDLLMDSSPQGMDILVQIFGGFGVRTPLRSISAETAMSQVKSHLLDLIVVDAQLSDMDGYDFVRWLRSSKIEPNCAAPVILLTGHTQVSNVTKGRDCGANFIVAKPLVPRILLDRVMWVARENRLFIESPTYSGPDRRFKFVGPPAGIEGRRADDLPIEVGTASTPNMSQDAIDSLLQPQKAQL
jgi:DNA-binding response OmpR family regulator